MRGSFILFGDFYVVRKVHLRVEAIWTSGPNAKWEDNFGCPTRRVYVWGVT
jgi:hypothetical protein